MIKRKYCRNHRNSSNFTQNNIFIRTKKEFMIIEQGSKINVNEERKQYVWTFRSYLDECLIFNLFNFETIQFY